MTGTRPKFKIPLTELSKLLMASNSLLSEPSFASEELSGFAGAEQDATARTYYHDVIFFCRDGQVPWNRFLLAANSGLLSDAMLEASSAAGTSQVLLPDVSADTLSSLLECTLNSAVRNDTLSVNEIEAMKLLGFDLLTSEEPRRGDRRTSANCAQLRPPGPVSDAFPDPEDTLRIDFALEVPPPRGVLRPGAGCRPQHAAAAAAAADDDDDNDDVGVVSNHAEEARLETELGQDGPAPPDAEGRRSGRQEGNPVRVTTRPTLGFECGECGKVFGSSENLRLHSLYHKDLSVAYDCNLCDLRPIMGRHALRAHTEKCHPANLPCRVCGKTFASSRLLQRHSKRVNHQQRRPMMMMTTTKTMIQPARGQQSRLQSDADWNDLTVKCLYCGKGFANLQSLSVHKSLAHHRVERASLAANRSLMAGPDDPVVHDSTSSAVDDQKVRNRPDVMEGPPVPPAGAVIDFVGAASGSSPPPASKSSEQGEDGSSASFSTQEHLSETPGQSSPISGKVGEDTKCGVCRKVFTSQQLLAVHQRRSHDKVAQECKLCKKPVKDIRKHLKVTHRQPPSPSASARSDCCGGGHDRSEPPADKEAAATATTTTNLVDVCPDCGVRLSSKYVLRDHRLRFHRQADAPPNPPPPPQGGSEPRVEAPEEDLECKECGKRFVNGSKLRRHLREGHTENRFECDDCGLFFPVRYSLERHVKNVHRAEKLQCPDCRAVVVHLAQHLVTAHKVDPAAARSVEDEASGTSAARTSLVLSDVLDLRKKKGRLDPFHGGDFD